MEDRYYCPLCGSLTDQDTLICYVCEEATGILGHYEKDGEFVEAEK